MQLRLIVALSFGAAVLSACPEPVAECGPSNCTGCCDSARKCQPGTDVFQCGNSGQICSPCSNGQTCTMNGTCFFGGTGGGQGGGSATGGGAATGGGVGGGATGGGTGGGMMTPACPAGFQFCGGKCVDALNDTFNCGACARACAFLSEGCTNGVCTALPADCRTSSCPANHYCDQTTGKCNGGCNTDQQCGANAFCSTSNACVCRPGFNRCGTQCVADTNPGFCGVGCFACFSGPGGTSSCVNGGCQTTCNTGFHKCGDQCVANNSINGCGTSCSPCTPPANATATCNGVSCDFVCNQGFHRCGNACLPNNSVNSCGSNCTACPVPLNGAASCNGVSCSVSCNPGFHNCNGQCVSNNSTASCGSSCSPCAPPLNATATCNGVSCGFTCNSGTHACGSTCALNTSVNSCGSSCTPCSAPVNGTATCNGTSCGFTCNFGFHACNGQCVSDSSINSCGTTSCTPCPAPPLNAVATCSNGTCGFQCNFGFHACNGQCVSNSSVNNCGTTSCTACAPPANATATCDGTSCGFTCATGFHACSGQCVSDTAVATCGTSNCTPCPQTPNSTASCTGIPPACGFSCAAGFHLCGNECVPDDFSGACGNPTCAACGAPNPLEKAICQGGGCTTLCQLSCNSACVNPQTDNAHCGMCNVACGSGQACSQGACRNTCTTGIGIARLYPFVTQFAAQTGQAVGDYNLDGIPDLVTIGGTGLYFRTGLGQGRYAAPSLMGLTTAIDSVQLADLNADGRADIIAAQSASNRLVVALATTGGTFSGNAILATGTSTGPRQFVVADLDGDGDPDLATANYFSGSGSTVGVFLNNGAGGFGPVTSFSVGTAGPFAIGAGDYTGDGKIDLVVARTTGLISVLAGNQATPLTFAAPLNSSGGPGTIVTLRTQDLTGDNLPDLLISGSSSVTGGVQVMTNIDGGVFVPGQLVTPRGVVAFQVRDLDKDSLPDLVMATSNTIQIARGIDAGVFTAGSTRFAGDTSTISSINLADVNADNVPDIVLSQTTGTFQIAGVDGGAFPDIGRLPSNVTNNSAAAIGDLDGDGDNDVFVTSSSAGATAFNGGLYRNDGAGNLTYDSAWPTRGNVPVIARLNADAFGDLITPFTSTTTPGIEVRMGSANLTLSSPVFYATTATPLKILVADLDGDAIADVITGGAGSFELLPGQAGGTFGTRRTFAVGGTVTGLAAGDLNADGRRDLVVTTSAISSNVRVYLGYAGGGLYPSIVTSQSSAVDPQLVDFNGDGRIDVLASVGTSVYAWIFGTTFAFPSPLVLGSFGNRNVALDFDGDGRLDVVGMSSEGLRVGRGLGGTSVGAAEIFGAGRNTYEPGAIGNLNGDAFPDWVGAGGSAAELANMMGSCRP